MNTEKFDNLIFEQLKDVTFLTLWGDVTEKDSNRLRSVLMRSLENSERIVVKFGNPINIDFLCLQLLNTAIKISERLKKFMVLTGNLTDTYKQRLKTSF